jgi:hypothetical protein
MKTLKERYEEGATFQEFLGAARSLLGLWNQISERTQLPEEAREAVGSLTGRWHFLVLAEDWCGDAVHCLPYLAKLEEAFPHFGLRILSREGNPDLMDSHLTAGSRSIPVVMILDENFQEVAWWGPRPAPLQELFLAEIKQLPTDERFPRLRAWYARDRGRTTLQEILDRIPVTV